MKRFIPFILGSGMFLAAGAVFAFSGSHGFTNVYSLSSNGHTSLSSYQATGSLPFDGKGNYDGSRISLLGTLSVSQQDGQPISPPQQYCLKVQGKVDNLGQGSITVTQYRDLRCKGVVGQGSYAVLSYLEGLDGSFNLRYQDGAGVVTTASGSHVYAR